MAAGTVIFAQIFAISETVVQRSGDEHAAARATGILHLNYCSSLERQMASEDDLWAWWRPFSGASCVWRMINFIWHHIIHSVHHICLLQLK